MINFFFFYLWSGDRMTKQTKAHTKKPREVYQPAAPSEKKPWVKELTHGLECLPDNPATSQAVDKPLLNTTTNTSCFCSPVVLDNRTFFFPHLRGFFSMKPFSVSRKNLAGSPMELSSVRGSANLVTQRSVNA
jgi:hypothetical protein